MDMDPRVLMKLAESNQRMTDYDQMVHIYHLLSQVLVFNVPGAVVELGCHEGKTSVFLQMIIDHFAPDRELHVYDSFQGMPVRGPADIFLDEGELTVTKEHVEEVFRQWGQKLPYIHAGWFKDTLPSSLPSSIAFAYLDGDYYDSILTSLEYVCPRLSKNAIVLIHDYCDLERNPRAWTEFPGVKQACNVFFARGKPEKIYVLDGSKDGPKGIAMGYFRKE